MASCDSREIFEDCPIIFNVSLGLGVQSGEGLRTEGGGVPSSRKSARLHTALPATKAPLLVAVAGAPAQEHIGELR